MCKKFQTAAISYCAINYYYYYLYNWLSVLCVTIFVISKAK